LESGNTFGFENPFTKSKTDVAYSRDERGVKRGEARLAAKPFLYLGKPLALDWTQCVFRDGQGLGPLAGIPIRRVRIVLLLDQNFVSSPAVEQVGPSSIIE
jgi:hypothetical protein